MKGLLKILGYAGAGLVAYEIYLHATGRCFYDLYLDPRKR